MAAVTLSPSNRDAGARPSQQKPIPPRAAERDRESEDADFELDDVLRGLALDRWFATAQRDVPIWAF